MGCHCLVRTAEASISVTCSMSGEMLNSPWNNSCIYLHVLTYRSYCKPRAFNFWAHYANKPSSITPLYMSRGKIPSEDRNHVATAVDGRAGPRVCDHTGEET